ncbi:MAG: ion channel [Rikenellaceae bacterium]
MAQLITTTKKILDPIVVLASITLLVALSVEIIGQSQSQFSRWYINLQGVICTIFIIDFVMIMMLDKRPWYYLITHIPMLIISLPYLSFLPTNSNHLHSELTTFIGMMPQLRAFLALYIVLRWIIRKPTVRRLFCAYILTVATLTYIAALLFYNSEIEANEHLSSFGDALWWAAMGLTTVGAAITPITTTGKILSVVMPLMGMMMLPISTSYLINIYKRR